MRQILTLVSILVTLLMTACGEIASLDSRRTKQAVGHYEYNHSWSYPVKEGHLYCSETGTMDFNADGTALDSAQQHYTLKFATGDCVRWTFSYISPSRWLIEGDKFLFAGDSAAFSMKVVQSSAAFGFDSKWIDDYGKKIINDVHKSIGRTTAFHLDKVDRRKVVWSYKHPDGHTDRWLFHRK